MPQKSTKIGTEKILHINSTFKGDVTNELLIRRLSNTVGSTFPAAKLGLTPSNHPLLKPQLKGQLRSLISSMCICRVNYFFGASYVCRTTRRLSIRLG